jgi:hypothetical protein
MATTNNPLGPTQGWSHAQLQSYFSRDMKKKMGFTRDPAPMLPEKPLVYIYNVSPIGKKWHQAGFDFYYVPPCEPGNEVSEPIFRWKEGQKVYGIPEFVSYEYLKIDSTSWAVHLARELASEILEIGPGKMADTDLRNKGFFASYNNPPTAAEIKECKDRWHKTLANIVSEADLIHSQGQRKGPDGQLINEEHTRAAAILGQKRAWAQGVILNVTCPGCGYDVPSNAPMHLGPGGCGTVIDWDAAIERGLKTVEDYHKSKKRIPKDKPEE